VIHAAVNILGSVSIHVMNVNDTLVMCGSYGAVAVLGGIVSAIFVLSMALFISLEERTVERAI
jgi:hypothetical protein